MTNEKMEEAKCEGISEYLKTYVDTIEADDAVNSPRHYTSGGIECIDAIREALGPAGYVGYLRGNIMKYLWRFDKKRNPVEDLRKARWYLNCLIEYERRREND